MKAEAVLPEVTPLYDGREARPENAVGIGDFWYEPEVLSLPLFPALKRRTTDLACLLAPNSKIPTPAVVEPVHTVLRGRRRPSSRRSRPSMDAEKRDRRTLPA